MRASVPASTRFGDTAPSPRRRGDATWRSARRAACFSVLLLATVATTVGSARGQDSKPDHVAQSREDEWTQLNDRIADAHGRGEFSQAVELATIALALAESAFGPDHVNTIASVQNLAFLYQAQGRYAEAEPLYRRELEAIERALGREHPQTLMFVHNLASMYINEGHYAEAEPLFHRVLEANERELGREHPYTLTSANNLAFSYNGQGRYAEAEALYLRVLEVRERVLGPEHPQTLLSVNNLAALYDLEGRYAEAEPLYLRTLEALERVLGSEHPNTLTSVSNLAILYQGQRRFAEAEPLFIRELEAMERALGGEHPQTLMSVNNLALLYYDQGRYAEAEPLLSRAHESLQRLVGREHPSSIGLALNLTLLRLSSAQPASAIESARLAVSSLRSRRRATASGEFAEAQRGREEGRGTDQFSLLADAAWAVAEAGGEDRTSLTAESFTALQDTTAGTTNQAVIRMAVRRVADDIGPRLGALVRERESLSNQWTINSANYSAALGGSHPNSEALRRTLPAERARIEVQIDEIDADLRRNFPQYFALIRPEPLDVTAAQALLAPDEAILMVVPTGFGTHVIAVSSTSIEWVRSEWTRERVDAAVQRLLWDVGASVGVSFDQQDEWLEQAGPGYPYDRTTAHDLYRQIVAPVAGVLAGKRHVFIAAGGSLTSLPFGMLVAEPPQGADGDPADLRATSWFADAHALTQIPSIQSLQFLRRFGRPSGQPHSSAGFVGFGDPVLEGPATMRVRNRGTAGTDMVSLFDPGRTRSGGSVVSLSRLSLMSRLPGTAVELENMRVALGAPREALFLADRATEANVKTADLTGARILVFATHGLAGGEILDLAEPGLVFTPPPTLSDVDNGFLTASEVSALRLDADWVILSACNTAAGDGSQGAPGLSGLARAFFYAGARNLLASHWPVGDDVAARLTVRTFQILNEQPSLSRAEGFQRAMREIRDDASHDSADDTWAHPSAWAPFTLIGDGAR